MLGKESSTSCMLGNYSTTELHPHPSVLFKETIIIIAASIYKGPVCAGYCIKHPVIHSILRSKDVVKVKCGER